eukprot:3223718-Prymnesium_polylepis.2
MSIADAKDVYKVVTSGRSYDGRISNIRISNGRSLSDKAYFNYKDQAYWMVDEVEGAPKLVPNWVAALTTALYDMEEGW